MAFNAVFPPLPKFILVLSDSGNWSGSKPARVTLPRK